MQSDVWNVSYVELRIWNQVSYDHRSYERNFKQLRVEAWKSQDFNGVEKGKKKSGLQRAGVETLVQLWLKSWHFLLHARVLHAIA